MVSESKDVNAKKFSIEYKIRSAKQRQQLNNIITLWMLGYCLFVRQKRSKKEFLVTDLLTYSSYIA